MIARLDYTLPPVILDTDDLDAIAAYFGQETVTPTQVVEYLQAAILSQLARDREELAASLDE